MHDTLRMYRFVERSGYLRAFDPVMKRLLAGDMKAYYGVCILPLAQSIDDRAPERQHGPCIGQGGVVIGSSALPAMDEETVLSLMHDIPELQNRLIHALDAAMTPWSTISEASWLKAMAYPHQPVEASRGIEEAYETYARKVKHGDVLLRHDRSRSGRQQYNHA